MARGRIRGDRRDGAGRGGGPDSTALAQLMDGVLGLLGGAVIGIPVAYAVGEASDSGSAAYTAFVACAVGGTVIGAKAMGETEEWLELYPERPPVAVPDSRRR